MSPAREPVRAPAAVPGNAPTTVPGPPRDAGSHLSLLSLLSLLRAVWLPSVLVALLVLSAAASLDAAFRAPVTGWMVPAAWPSLAGLAVAAVARSLGARMLRPLAAGLLAAGWVWCRQWWPETMMAGLAPQPATAEAILESSEELRVTVWTEIIPVASTDALLAGLGAVLALTALVTDAIATGLRSPALAGLPALALIGGAAAITTGLTPQPALALAAAAWLALLAAVPVSGTGTGTDTGTGGANPGPQGLPRRRAGWTAGWGAVATAVIGLGVLTTAQTGLPLLTTGVAPEGQRLALGQGSGPVNPAADLSQQLRSGSGYTGITYRTTDGQGHYLRTAVVDDVMAAPWDASPPRYAGDPTTTGFHPAAAQLAEDPESPTDGRKPDGQLVSLTLEGWAGHWAPVPDQAATVEPTVGDWGWQVDPTTSSAYREATTPVDLTFDTMVLPLGLTLEQLSARAGSVAPQDVYNRWGATDELEGSAVQELAEELTDGVDNPVEQAVAFQDHLLSDEFRYSETAPAEQGYDGSGLELTEQFLAAGAGYCIHFASAMVMMAQSVDIPARVVVGYAPVAAIGGEHRVTADRAHAWPELYIDQVGWVPFEPTQTVGRTPSYGRQDPTAGPTPAEDPTAGADATPQPSASEDVQSPTDDAGPGTTGGSGPSGAPGIPPGAVITVAVGLAALALAAAFPAWLRSRRRARRLGTRRPGAPTAPGATPDAVPQWWAELEDTAVDLGVGRAPHESEQVFAARIGAIPAVAEAVEWSRYAPAGTEPPPGLRGGSTLADSVRATIAALEDAAEPAVRRRARWFPRSLVPEPLRR